MNHRSLIWPCRIATTMSADDLRVHGPLLPAWWLSPNSGTTVQRIGGNVLLDTGASGMMIDEALATELGLPVQGEEKVHGAHGYGTLRKYVAKLVLPVVDSSGATFAFGIPAECSGMPDLAARYATKGQTVVGILGRNFLQFCTLSIDGSSGEIVVEISQAVLSPRA